MSANTEQRKLAAIMFTDMVGYSRLAQRDEKLALQLLEEHRALLRSIFPKFNGTEVKTIGDGFLVEFNSALEAAQCAIEIQRALANRNHNVPSDRRIDIRIGIHIGDVVHRAGDVYGDGVNIASRIERLANPGGICVSMDVERQIRNALEARFEKLAPTELKNISVPMDLFRIVLPWEKQAPIAKSKTVSTLASHKVLTATAALLLLFLIGFGWWSSDRPRRSSRSPAATSAPGAGDHTSIAVLPFVNMSADKGDEYLSDGMTEELISVLGKVPGLRVPGRTSCFAFKGKNEEDIFRKVGGQLHVGTVLEGSVRKFGDKLRVTAQLINVSDGYHLWSKDYDGDAKDILNFQSNVAEQVVQALKMKLGVAEARALEKKPTDNSEAHRLYLLGRYHLDKFTEADVVAAVGYFEQALQVDPNFALAYCGLADAYEAKGGNTMASREAWAKQKIFARKALALDPDLPEAHLSFGTALMGSFDWANARNEINRALELNPNLALAHDASAWLLTIFGRFDEAVEKEKKALELDPLNPYLNDSLGWSLYWAGRYDEAMQQLRSSIELFPNNAFSHFVLGWCLLKKGNATEAMAELQKAANVDDLPWYIGWLGYAYGLSGEPAKADQILHDLGELAKKRYVTPGALVPVYLGLGDKEKTLDWLEKSYEEQDGVCWQLKIDQRYNGLRNEPRFQALVQAVFPETQ